MVLTVLIFLSAFRSISDASTSGPHQIKRSVCHRAPTVPVLVSTILRRVDRGQFARRLAPGELSQVPVLRTHPHRTWLAERFEALLGGRCPSSEAGVAMRQPIGFSGPPASLMNWRFLRPGCNRNVRSLGLRGPMVHPLNNGHPGFAPGEWPRHERPTPSTPSPNST